MVLLIIGAAVSGWSFWNQKNEDAATIASGAGPDYILDNFELVVLDEAGEESFTLRAPKMERDPANRTMDLTTPVFLIPPGRDAGTDAWEVRSRTGWVSEKGDEVRLSGEVRAVSDGAAGVPMTIATEQLNIFPENNRVSSAVGVSFTRPGSILRGRGLDMQLDTKLYTLHSEVRWHYAPTR